MRVSQEKPERDRTDSGGTEVTLSHEEAVTCSKYLHAAARNIGRGMDINDIRDVVQESILRLL